jgi:hypothetical protein
MDYRFCSVVMPVADQAAASCPGPHTGGAAATPFDPLDFNAITHVELIDRGFDVEAFMEAIEPLPLFLEGRPLGADDLMPVLSLLADHM